MLADPPPLGTNAVAPSLCIPERDLIVATSIPKTPSTDVNCGILSIKLFSNASNGTLSKRLVINCNVSPTDAKLKSVLSNMSATFSQKPGSLIFNFLAMFLKRSPVILTLPVLTARPDV